MTRDDRARAVMRRETAGCGYVEGGEVSPTLDCVSTCRPLLLEQPQEYPGGFRWLEKLVAFARVVEARLDCKFYLVGSALHSKVEPGDVDVYGSMDDEKFAALIGEAAEWERQIHSGYWKAVVWLWSDLCVGLTRFGREITGINLDVKVFPRSTFEAHPRCREAENLCA
jgi:hypothetical protein